MTGGKLRQIPVLTVNQWLPGWEDIDFNPNEHRAKPAKSFYLFSLPARELRSLSGIARRVTHNGNPRTSDLGIQRQHDPERSEEISRFVEYGFPWSTLSSTKRQSNEFNDLRKPGWLPTALVVNIVAKDAERNGSKVADKDLVTIVEVGGEPRLQLPYEKWSDSWSASKLPPFEVIDGQHRLWAFENAAQLEGFELPVVAFVGLDVSWQAYLFWTINIKPKRINPSLAFDLYPLLRNEDWLERAEGHSVYRETRAQELTEIMWSYPESPWYDRINMLGERGIPWVTQSAWIKSLTATFIRPWDKRSKNTGGLFGSREKNVEVLGWSRGQQAAFLIFAWNCLVKSVEKSTESWAQNLRELRRKSQKQGSESEIVTDSGDPAFYGQFSLINTDQGVRGYLHVLNDLSYRMAARLKMKTWLPDARSSSDPIAAVKSSLANLPDQAFASFINSISSSLASFDWRTSATPDLPEALRRAKLVFRGSGGYKELRTQLLEHLAQGDGDVAEAAKRLISEA